MVALAFILACLLSLIIGLLVGTWVGIQAEYRYRREIAEARCAALATREPKP